MNVTTLATDLFESIKYIAETTAQKYDNIIIGTIINDDNKINHRYDVLINDNIYKNLYSAINTDLQIDDQVYLIKLNNEDTKVVIGGLYYPNTQLFNNNLLDSFIRGNRSNLCNTNFKGNNLSLRYDQSVLDGIWSNQNFTRLYFKTTIMPKTQNIDLTKQLGIYGLDLKFSSVTEKGENEIVNYEQTFNDFFSSNNLVCNPYIISPEFGYTIEKVIDISNIPNVFNKLEFTKFVRDFSENVNFDIDFIDTEIYLGFDIEELNGSKLFLGTKVVNNENDEPIINSELTFNDTDFTKQLALTYVNVDDDTQKLIEITDINEIKDAEIRWYKYSYGEIANDEYGGEDWVLLDRAYETFTGQPIKTENGYYCLSEKGKNQQSLERTVNLNIRENKVSYKAVLIIDDQPLTSNEITFTNGKEGADIQDTSLIMKLNEYTENVDSNNNVTKTTNYYYGVYNIYEQGQILGNPPIVRMIINSSQIVNNNADSILWKIPKNCCFDLSDLNSIKIRNNDLLVSKFGFSSSDNTYKYDYFQDDNFVYFKRSLRAVSNINVTTSSDDGIIEAEAARFIEYFELKLKNSYTDSSTNTVYCYLLSNNYTELPKVHKEVYDNVSVGQTYQEYIDEHYNNIIENNQEIRLLGIAKGGMNNRSLDNFLLYSYYKLHTIQKTFYSGYVGANGTDYQIQLNFAPPSAYSENYSDGNLKPESQQKDHTILAPNQPYLILQGTLMHNGQVLDLKEYDSAIADWVFPEEDYKLKAFELDYTSQLQTEITTTGATSLLAQQYIEEGQNQKSKFWLVLPDCELDFYNGISDIEQIEQYYLDYVRKMGRYFRNALITLGYEHQFPNTNYKTLVYNHFAGYIDNATQRSSRAYFNAFVDYLKNPDLTYAEIAAGTEAFDNFWEEIEKKNSSTMISTLNKNAYNGILKPLQKVYDYHLSTLKTAYRCYLLCRTYLKKWTSDETYITDSNSGDNAFGVYEYGPGKIFPTQNDKNKDLDLKDTYQTGAQEDRLQIIGQQFAGWSSNYNILNFKIPELNINKIKPIPISTRNIDNGNTGFTGQLEIYYNNNGQIITSQKQHYNYNNMIQPSQNGSLYVTIQTNNNQYLNKNIDYKSSVDFDLFISGTSKKITQKFGSKVNNTQDDFIEIIYPNKYPTENNTDICIRASLLFGAQNSGHFYIYAMTPLCIMINRYGNNLINQDSGATSLDKTNQKVTSAKTLIGEKNINTQTYNGWYLNEDGAEFHEKGQICASLKDNILTLGPTGNQQLIIDPTNQNLQTASGTIKFSELYNLIETILRTKRLKIGDIDIDNRSATKKIIDMGNVVLDGYNQKIQLGDIYITVDRDEFSITKNYSANSQGKFTFDLNNNTLKCYSKYQGTTTTYTFDKTVDS